MTEAIETLVAKSIHESLADLLDYPSANWSSLMESCARLVGEKLEVSEAFANFREGVDTLSLNELQELYTRTFDLSPVCTLDIGYHLFGENYKRGVFLANLRETEAPFALGQEHQLPDYLPVLLRLLTKLDDEELRGALIVDCMIPAINKMIAALKNGENPYRCLLAAVQTALRSEPGVDLGEPAPRLFGARASLPVLTNDRDWVSGSAARCAVVAPPHRDDPLQINWGYAPEARGAAPNFEDVVPEGQRPSAHRLAEPQGRFGPQRS